MKDLRPSKIIFATISIFVLIASALAIEWPWDKEPIVSVLPLAPAWSRVATAI
jgi:hypothetical protein